MVLVLKVLWKEHPIVCSSFQAIRLGSMKLWKGDSFEKGDELPAFGLLACMFVVFVVFCKTILAMLLQRKRQMIINASRVFVVFCKPIFEKLLHRTRLIARMRDAPLLLLTLLSWECRAGEADGALQAASFDVLWFVNPGQVYYSAKIWDHESHKAAWATSKVSRGLNLATLE